MRRINLCEKRKHEIYIHACWHCIFLRTRNIETIRGPVVFLLNSFAYSTFIGNSNFCYVLRYGVIPSYKYYMRIGIDRPRF